MYGKSVSHKTFPECFEPFLRPHWKTSKDANASFSLTNLFAWWYEPAREVVSIFSQIFSWRREKRRLQGNDSQKIWQLATKKSYARKSTAFAAKLRKYSEKYHEKVRKVILEMTSAWCIETVHPLSQRVLDVSSSLCNIVENTISSPFLTHKFASTLSLNGWANGDFSDT